MSIFSIWGELGFKANPYSEETLQANDIGNRLLVGRDREMTRLMRGIGDSGAHPTVEGPIGAGKTSMINVAIYRMHQACLEANSAQLYLPADGKFQPVEDPAQFERHLYEVLAQTLIKYKDEFAKVGLPTPDVRSVDKRGNVPQYISNGAGSPVPDPDQQESHGSGLNQTMTESEFQRNVRELLKESFPEGSGGIVCIMDNLEILKTAGKARETLDELRDNVFNIPHVRWVLSGSRGIVSRAKSEKLSGVMRDPMILKPIGDAAASDAITRRIEEYGTVDAVVPVSPASFDFLYQTFGRNLREAMVRAGDFSGWFYDHYVDNVDEDIPDVHERDTLVESWLMEIAELGFANSKSVRPRHWTFFDAFCADEGRAASSEWATYNFNNPSNFATAVTDLVNAQLMVRELDRETGRAMNSVTPAGWLVYFFRQNSLVPEEAAAEEEGE